MKTLPRSSVHMCKLNFGMILWNRLYINCILNLTYRPCLSFSTEKKCSLILHFGMELRYGLYISEEREIYRKKIIVCYFREAAKKSFLKGEAIKGWGVMDFFCIFIFLPFKIKIFTLDNLSKYGHITLKIVGRYLYWVVTIFPKK